MTDLDLGKEYRTVATEQRLSFDEIAAVALDGIEASWLDKSDRRWLRAEFERTLAGLRPAPGGGPGRRHGPARTGMTRRRSPA